MTDIQSMSSIDQSEVEEYRISNENNDTDLDYDNEQNIFENLTLLKNLKNLRI